jgi:hypothetical protein
MFATSSVSASLESQRFALPLHFPSGIGFHPMPSEKPAEGEGSVSRTEKPSSLPDGK